MPDRIPGAREATIYEAWNEAVGAVGRGVFEMLLRLTEYGNTVNPLTPMPVSGISYIDTGLGGLFGLLKAAAQDEFMRTWLVLMLEQRAVPDDECECGDDRSDHAQWMGECECECCPQFRKAQSDA